MFKVHSEYSPAGDQPYAISELTNFLKNEYSPKEKYFTLLGVTGSGKTFTMANTIQNINKPALILAPNKTLAAQLYNEFKDFFPENAVEFFISYYDYYQPESYIPSTDTYIEKTAKVNEEIDKLRHRATRSIFERNDVIIVGSVSTIYGLGEPDNYYQAAISIATGMPFGRNDFMTELISILFERNDFELTRGKFRVRGDVLDVFPTYEEELIRIEFFGDEIETIKLINPVDGKIIEKVEEIKIYPAKHYIANTDLLEGACKEIEKQLDIQVAKLQGMNKPFEAIRLNQRTRYDIEMLREVGYCNGIENYSPLIEQRKPGQPPKTLIDYFRQKFGNEWLCIIDESHISTPQIKGMQSGDASRKQTLIDYGFRLPCAKDNRPLSIDEFWDRTPQILFVSATPGNFEKENSIKIVEQVIRPTGLIDPIVQIRPTQNQIPELIEHIRIRAEKDERVLITTLTKRQAEDLSRYMEEAEVRARWLHSDLKPIERIEILRDLRMGEFDVLIGVNLLREGLDLPEVSLVAILDADKEGFLRSKSALIQTIGRAARNACGEVILFADRVTDSMQGAIDTIDKYREKQLAHNKKYNITPQTIKKAQTNRLLEAFKNTSKDVASILLDEMVENKAKSKTDIEALIKKLEEQMLLYAKQLDFERAAEMRDQLSTLRKSLKEK